MSNALEMRAQLKLRASRFSEAETDLETAAKILAADGTTALFFVHKWRTVSLALRTNNAEPLRVLAAEAKVRQEWETAREADLFALKIAFNETQFNRLLFGTSFGAYRERIMTEAGPAVVYRLAG